MSHKKSVSPEFAETATSVAVVLRRLPADLARLAQSGARVINYSDIEYALTHNWQRLEQALKGAGLSEDAQNAVADAIDSIKLARSYVMKVYYSTRAGGGDGRATGALLSKVRVNLFAAAEYIEDSATTKSAKFTPVVPLSAIQRAANRILEYNLLAQLQRPVPLDSAERPLTRMRNHVEYIAKLSRAVWHEKRGTPISAYAAELVRAADQLVKVYSRLHDKVTSSLTLGTPPKGSSDIQFVVNDFENQARSVLSTARALEGSSTMKTGVKASERSMRADILKSFDDARRYATAAQRAAAQEDADRALAYLRKARAAARDTQAFAHRYGLLPDGQRVLTTALHVLGEVEDGAGTVRPSVLAIRLESLVRQFDQANRERIVKAADQQGMKRRARKARTLKKGSKMKARKVATAPITVEQALRRIDDAKESLGKVINVIMYHDNSYAAMERVGWVLGDLRPAFNAPDLPRETKIALQRVWRRVEALEATLFEGKQPTGRVAARAREIYAALSQIQSSLRASSASGAKATPSFFNNMGGKPNSYTSYARALLQALRNPVWRNNTRRLYEITSQAANRFNAYAYDGKDKGAPWNIAARKVAQRANDLSQEVSPYYPASTNGYERERGISLLIDALAEFMQAAASGNVQLGSRKARKAQGDYLDNPSLRPIARKLSRAVEAAYALYGRGDYTRGWVAFEAAWKQSRELAYELKELGFKDDARRAMAVHKALSEHHDEIENARRNAEIMKRGPEQSEWFANQLRVIFYNMPSDWNR